VPCPLFKTQAHRPAPCLGMRDSILSNPLRPSPVKIYRSLCPTAWDAGTPKRDTSLLPDFIRPVAQAEGTFMVFAR